MALGRALVDRHLATCVNVLDGMTSIYRWEGALHEDREAVLIAKTTEAKASSVVATVKELHSYSVPCVLVLPVVGGNADYLAWLSGG